MTGKEDCFSEKQNKNRGAAIPVRSFSICCIIITTSRNTGGSINEKGLFLFAFI